MDNSLKELLETLEKERDTLMRSNANQPTKLGISSASALLTDKQLDSSYSSFTVNLRRPALNVQGLQLVKLNVPQVNPSFGDYELCFYYYRLRTQQNIDGSVTFSEMPNVNNLYCVRLLPSYYKTEFIANADLYGRNRIFNSYSDLASELAKACQSDLAYNNDPQHSFPFIPGDISLTYSSTLNLFQMTGNNVLSDFRAPIWNGQTIYDPDFIVNHNGVYYISIQQSGNNQPNISPLYWLPYSRGDTPYNTYLIASPDDPNIATLASKQYTATWNSLHIYNIDDIVMYDDMVYISTSTNQNRQPPKVYKATSQYYAGDLVYYNNATWLNLTACIDKTPVEGPLWTQYAKQDWRPQQGQSAPMKLGINGLSQKWDFELLSVPGQPSNVSTRNLAQRLGFTWNDSDDLLANLKYPQSYSPGSNLPSVLNRLRPVPIYSTSGLLASYPAFTTGTITADSYANLVRSSVLYVYCNIVNTSTLDSERVNGLLAIAPMNCPSLGISFSGDSIEQALTKVSSDIYSLTFTFFDEAGQRYYLPNSAIVTMEIKLTY